jgi:hypothetical protein
MSLSPLRLPTDVLPLLVGLLANKLLSPMVLPIDALLVLLLLLTSEVRVALIGLGGVKLVFSTVSLNLTNLLVLPDPTSYLESELLSSYLRFLPFLGDFFNAFLSFAIFSVSCAKLCLAG